MSALHRAALVLKHDAANVPLPPGQTVGLVLDPILDRLFQSPAPSGRRMRRVFGMVLVVTGAGITVWAVAERRMRSNGSFALSHPEDLVTTGPYSLSRHPMYLGWWLIHSGIAIFRGSSGALATLPAGILVEHVGVLWEEKALLTKFGYKYAEYMRAVPRYVGNPASRLMRADKPQ